MTALRLPPGRLLLRPQPDCWWMAGGLGAFCPVFEADGSLHLYLGGRDAGGRTHIGRLRFDWDDVPALRDIGEPVLAQGALGCFDQDGGGYPWVVRAGDALRMYYVGWQRLGGAVPFRNQIGLAVSHDGGRSFRRHSRAALLPATDAEPIGNGSCAVEEVAPGRWRMLYTNFLSWEQPPDQPPRHRYQLHTAWSDDGLRWRRPGTIAVPLEEPEEYALGAPAPWRPDLGSNRGPDRGPDRGPEQMFFTARGTRYHLFLASADNPEGCFSRHPVPIEIPAGRWDDAMQCYPRVARRGGQDYLFYAGNGYGRAGIGFIALPPGWGAAA